MKEIHLNNFGCNICNNFEDMCIAVKMFIFLCVARMFHYFKEQDPQKQPNKHSDYQVENMATTCYPGQLCVVFDVCFQLQPLVLSGCLAAPSV